MPPILRVATVTALATMSLAFASSGGAFADGRDDWSGYAWQQIEIADCVAAASVLQCPLYHEKWDWKRDQWVDISIAIDMASGTLRLDQRLIDKDRNDQDYVCVTAIAVDAAGNNVVAHHQNWYMQPKQDETQSFDYNSSRLADIAVIHIGSKQCRQGPVEDDALYADVLARIHS
jgi:hypothetical protein